MDIVKLREVLEAELSSEELTPLDSEFYRDFRSLVKAYRASAESSKSRGESVEERIYLEMERIAQHLMREIVRIRLHKIIDMAFRSVPVELPKEERDVFLLIRSFLEGEPAKVPAAAVEETEKIEENKETAKPVDHAYLVTLDLPSIIAPDLTEYGPIKSGDLVVLPDEIGKALMERNAAFRVTIKTAGR